MVYVGRAAVGPECHGTDGPYESEIPAGGTGGVEVLMGSEADVEVQDDGEVNTVEDTLAGGKGPDALRWVVGRTGVERCDGAVACTDEIHGKAHGAEASGTEANGAEVVGKCPNEETCRSSKALALTGGDGAHEDVLGSLAVSGAR